MRYDQPIVSRTMPVVALPAAAAILVAAACASTAPENDDPRLSVSASLLTRGDESRPTSQVLFRVQVINQSDHILLIRRVEVDPIGGGSVRGAHVTPKKRIEPGEVASFDVWAEIDPQAPRGLQLWGVGHEIAKVYVSFDDGEEKVLASYVVDL